MKVPTPAVMATSAALASRRLLGGTPDTAPSLGVVIVIAAIVSGFGLIALALVLR